MAVGETLGIIDLVDDVAVGPEELSGASLLAPADCMELQRRWAALSDRFADSPRDAVAAADALVADALQTLSRRFAYTRALLDTQWSHGREADPDDLRAARDLYRLLIRRLLG